MCRICVVGCPSPRSSCYCPTCFWATLWWLRAPVTDVKNTRLLRQADWPPDDCPPPTCGRVIVFQQPGYGFGNPISFLNLQLTKTPGGDFNLSVLSARKATRGDFYQDAPRLWAASYSIDNRRPPRLVARCIALLCPEFYLTCWRRPPQCIIVSCEVHIGAFPFS